MPAPDRTPDDTASARVAGLDAEIAATRARLTRLRRTAADAADRSRRLAATHAAATSEHRATPDGLSASMRALELALLQRRPPAELRRLQRQHVQAELDAAVEYRARTARWGHTPGDGPLQACPIGAGETFTSWILHLGIVGTYRHSVDHPADTIAVRLSRSRDTNRGRRAKINTPAALITREGLTLSTVFAAAVTNPVEDTKLRRWLGEHYTPIAAASAR
ncbi:hypothetical protein [Prescottella subtropica]|uniref:hypothetical protein n=1 Tax=Prescottella subtropica TaxID=2545757 RepID=UPI0010F74318|nr:hypothetical protein [Prescottella subtropica]